MQHSIKDSTKKSWAKSTLPLKWISRYKHGYEKHSHTHKDLNIMQNEGQ